MLKAVREKKQTTYKGKNHSRFLNRNLKSKRAWSEVLCALNETDLNSRLPYPAKLSFKKDVAIKFFTISRNQNNV
jgi:hypothetical protein